MDNYRVPEFGQGSAGEVVFPLHTANVLIDLVGGDAARNAAELVVPGGSLMSIVDTNGAGSMLQCPSRHSEQGPLRF
jgi:NADPH:quinone reductase-like Zn-dependent oxidoreductase